MNKDEIKAELRKMPQEELIENLTYLICEMPDTSQAEFLGLEG